MSKEEEKEGDETENLGGEDDVHSSEEYSYSESDYYSDEGILRDVEDENDPPPVRKSSFCFFLSSKS